MCTSLQMGQATALASMRPLQTRRTTVLVSICVTCALPASNTLVRITSIHSPLCFFGPSSCFRCFSDWPNKRENGNAGMVSGFSLHLCCSPNSTSTFAVKSRPCCADFTKRFVFPCAKGSVHFAHSDALQAPSFSRTHALNGFNACGKRCRHVGDW